MAVLIVHLSVAMAEPDWDSGILGRPESRHGASANHIFEMGFRVSAGGQALTEAGASRGPSTLSRKDMVAIRKQDNECASIIKPLIVNYPQRHNLMCYPGKNKIA